MKKEKSRVLFIGTLPPPVHGSAVVSQQIKDSKVINDAFDSDWINLGTSRAMDEIGKKTFAKPFRLLGALCKEFWFLLTKRYDLCYLAITCHGSGFLKDSPFILMAKLFGKKIVIHQHNKGMANDVDRWPYKWLLPLCYKNAKVILLSWYLYPDIEKVVPRENVYICPNGIKVQEFKSSPETCNLKPETNGVPRLLFLSNLIESKGVLVLLDALKILKDKGYSFICDFVGGETKEIDAKRFNEEVEKRGLNEIAIYQGRKYGEEKENAFEQSDVFVLPTFNETFGLVNLEAMAHKKPVVSTNEGGIPDVIKDGENGLISERKNPDSLAQCIAKLLDSDELRERMGEAGYLKLKEQFTEVTFEKNLFQIVNTMCASGGGKISICVYHGKKYGEEKQEALGKADVFVLPTMNDCFPLVILEAMEQGKPVVTTAIGGIPDIVDDNATGLIAQAGDAQSLANSLGRLLKDKDLVALFGENGKKKLLEQYTEKNFESTLLEILQEIILQYKTV